MVVPDCVHLGLCQENMGSSNEELCAVDVTEPVSAAPAKQLPEYNGFGSLEDSAQNCTSLVNAPKLYFFPPSKRSY